MQKFKVVVADDEKLILNYMAKQIEKANEAFQVVGKARDGLEAYKLVSELSPDVVFSDIKMPELDGISLIKRLRLEFPYIRVVLVSGYNDFEYAREALRNQAVDYLLKPCPMEDLKKTLQRLETLLCSDDQKISPQREDSPAEIVQSVMVFLQENYSATIDFSEIAATKNISSSYLSKIFREYANTSPSKYLSDCRLQHAKKLLNESTHNIKDIGMMVGYGDPLHFSKFFKNATGLSPKQYREKSTP
ncbi:MAG: response regulator [Bacillota bacterium]